ncbi:hypothetical protein XA68_16179 [Ophiocordyceps unilateralis]|uniref:Dickkopf N-terminal cysteine-rich domain-containing protein n=1 Tax=Ophiocordyceps unilateralis TaxID=268505 RepID=A0A2A9P5E9_OPHUN|nr:hypothetical protein XA68_16179 [Ophiocordyceps unilateralis]
MSRFWTLLSLLLLASTAAYAVSHSGSRAPLANITSAGPTTKSIEEIAPEVTLWPPPVHSTASGSGSAKATASETLAIVPFTPTGRSSALPFSRFVATSDGLAIGESGSSSSSFVVSTASASSSSTVKAELRPCEPGHDRAAEDCRVQLAGRCSRSQQQYPTCVDNQCVCLTTPCSDKETCQQRGLCLDEEEAGCQRGRSRRFPHFPGVCECAPKGEECGSQGRPHEFCQGIIKCTELHRDLYPPFPQCVNGRCQCGRVECNKTHDDMLDRASCQGLISCPDGRSLFPYCNAKFGPAEHHGRRSDGYCTCAWHVLPTRNATDETAG